MLKSNCKTCNKEFSYYPSNKSGQYCSLPCAYKSKERYAKLNIIKKGDKHRKGTLELMSKQRKGVCHSSLHVKKRIDSFLNHHGKNTELVREKGRLRNGKKSRAWKEALLERDKHCQKCGDTKSLQAHHIIPFFFLFEEYKLSGNEEILYCLDNGVILCKECHKQTDSYQKNKNSSPEYKLMNIMKKYWKDKKASDNFDSWYKAQLEKIGDNYLAKVQ